MDGYHSIQLLTLLGWDSMCILDALASDSRRLYAGQPLVGSDGPWAWSIGDEWAQDWDFSTLALARRD